MFKEKTEYLYFTTLDFKMYQKQTLVSGPQPFLFPGCKILEVSLAIFSSLKCYLRIDQLTVKALSCVGAQGVEAFPVWSLGFCASLFECLG
jgi:hypothetical protein